MKIISRKLQEMSNPENQRRFYPIPVGGRVKWPENRRVKWPENGLSV